MPDPGFELTHLDQVLGEARGAGREWTEFLRAGMFSAGVYRLAAGGTDTQTPHAEDEIYCVLAGRAQLEVEGQRRPVAPGSIAFVGRRREHRFVDITEDLEVLVVFAPPESVDAEPGPG